MVIIISNSPITTIITTIIIIRLLLIDSRVSKVPALNRPITRGITKGAVVPVAEEEAANNETTRT